MGQLLGVRPKMGSEALVAQVKACRSPRVLHLCTHGFSIPKTFEIIEGEVLGLEAGQNVVFNGLRLALAHQGDFRVDHLVLDPMLCCGLALAGANTWVVGGDPGAEAGNGLLTAYDVTEMDLSGTELVVLSACDTGKGTLTAGEGVFGLRRAFAIAGARAMIVSLWKVPDHATNELMQEFYRRFTSQPSPGPLMALRDAQKVIRIRYPAVSHWGAFICLGNPNPA